MSTKTPRKGTTENPLSDRTAARVLLVYLALCAVGGVLLLQLTKWPLPSVIFVLILGYLLLAFVAAVILRPLALLGMLIYKAFQRRPSADT